jgi:hypothetical protein
VQLNVYDLTGSLLLSKNEDAYDTSPINLRALSPGMYIIEITDNKNMHQFDKLIIH